MIRLLIADDEALERETLADIVARRFEHEVTIETAENGRKDCKRYESVSIVHLYINYKLLSVC